MRAHATHMRARARTHMYKHTRTNDRARAHARTQAHTRARAQEHTHTLAHARTRLHARTRTRTHTPHAHTYTHTHTQVIEGDGGFQMNIQEMQTIVRNNLPIRVVILNNGCLGMLRTFCTTGFAGRLHGAAWGYDVPDFARVGIAYEWGGETISRPSDIDAALERLWADPARPYILNVIIPAETYCAPRVPFGKALDAMIPARPGEPMPQPSAFIVVRSDPPQA